MSDIDERHSRQRRKDKEIPDISIHRFVEWLSYQLLYLFFGKELPFSDILRDMEFCKRADSDESSFMRSLHYPFEHHTIEPDSSSVQIAVYTEVDTEPVKEFQLKFIKGDIMRLDGHILVVLIL